MTAEGKALPDTPHWLQEMPVTWDVGQGTLLHFWQGECQVHKLCALVPHGQLDQEDRRGHLQVEAVLQHLRLTHRGFGGEIDGHEALKLLPKAVCGGAGALLSLSPGHLQPVEALVDFDQLVVQPAQSIPAQIKTRRKERTKEAMQTTS